MKWHNAEHGGGSESEILVKETALMKMIVERPRQNRCGSENLARA
jgi:hypothetical protein